MKEYGLYESAAVKVQTIKTAIEVRGRSFSRRPSRLLTRTPPLNPLSLTVCLPFASRRRVSRTSLPQRPRTKTDE